MSNITDEQALAALDSKVAARAQSADTYATRTILYPVEIERSKGMKSIEPRPYVIQGQYYPKRKWEKALDVEKRYAGLNKRYREELKAKGLPVDKKDPGNILNTTPIDMKY